GGEGRGAPRLRAARDAVSLREPVRDHARGLEARPPRARECPLPGPRRAVPPLERRALLPRLRRVRGEPQAPAWAAPRARGPRRPGAAVRRAGVLLGDRAREGRRASGARRLGIWFVARRGFPAGAPPATSSQPGPLRHRPTDVRTDFGR